MRLYRLLLTLLVVAGCSGDPVDPDPSPSPEPATPSPTPPPIAPYAGPLKLEWGSLRDESVTWTGQLSFSGAMVREIVPYVFEDGDVVDAERLEFSGLTDNLLTDGLLLDARVEVGGDIEIATVFGDVMTSLDDLEVDEARFLMFDSARYVEVSRLTADEWELALSYNTRPTNRSDAMPEPAYMTLVESGRYNSETSQASIIAEAEARYETDAFFRNAEDLRRGVSEQLYVVAPSVIGVGESFDISVSAFDIYGHLVADFDAAVQLSVEGAELSLPKSVAFTVGRNSTVTVADAGLALEPGYARIVAVDPSGRFASGAIPVRIEDAPEERVYWGDLHTHSNLSDGDFGDVGPEDVYRYGRDVGHLDFTALSDHDYRRPIPDWKWPRHIAAAAEYYEPGRFVTLLGYEWSGEDMGFSDVISHKNVYFRDAEGPVYSAWDPRYNTPEKLWAALRRSPGAGRAITIPHHSVRNIVVTEESPWYGGAGTDWRFHDPELQPLVEVYSRWGISEYTGQANPRPVRDTSNKNSAQYAIGLGYRLGFMASGDTHDGTPGVSVLPYRQGINAYPTGVVAVFAPSLIREEIFDGLYTRRCYGTSGSRRMLLDLRTTTGIRAGEEGPVEGAPNFRIDVAGTTALRNVELVRIDAGGATTVWTGSSSDWRLEKEVTDEDFPGEASYHLRVTQADDELGWIGPIFLSGP